MAINKDLQPKVDEIVRQAKRRGLDQDETFTALLDDFMYKKKIMERLREKIDSMSLEVEREYIKGKPHETPNSYISTYNATSNAMCNTVSAMSKLLKVTECQDENAGDPLLRVLEGKR